MENNLSVQMMFKTTKFLCHTVKRVYIEIIKKNTEPLRFETAKVDSLSVMCPVQVIR